VHVINVVGTIEFGFGEVEIGVPIFNTSKGLYMKTTLPLERLSSLGRVQSVAAIVAAASISFLPFSSALANHTGGGGGGGHASGGGGHTGGGGHSGFSGGHGSYSRPAASYHGGGSRTAYSGAGRNFSHTSYHASLYARNTNSTRVSSQHAATADRHQTSVNQHRDPGLNRVTNTSHPLNRTNKSEVARTTRGTDPAHVADRAIANRAPAFNHSLTATSAHGLMNQRLNQIANRNWGGHDHFFEDHFDRDHGCWFNHGGYWWRCNYWGANWYCNNLIGLGFAPGLCWGWYDDICGGNIVIGMPLDLVDYYYPDPVYSDYGDYDGDEATVYYYATDDGQYKQVTVIDGKVVDVQIVDHIS
jgi:hypothetical protein